MVCIVYIQQWFEQVQYVAHAYAYLPITFLKRVVLGRDSQLKQYFFDKWGLIHPFPKSSKQKIHIWFNTCSGGEIIQVMDLCEHLAMKIPNVLFFLSTESEDVFRFAKQSGVFCFVFYSPWDLKSATKRAIQRIQPDLLVAIDFTTLPTLFYQAQKKGVKTLLLSAMMRNRFDEVPGVRRAMAKKYYLAFHQIGVKSDDDFHRFVHQGVSAQKISVTGDMKYGLGQPPVPIRSQLQNIFRLKSSTAKIFLAGSTNLDEDSMTLDAYCLAKEKIPDLKFIIIPRYREYINHFKELARYKNIAYVEWSDHSEILFKAYDVLLVNAFGSLRYLYGVADYIYIGSSLIVREACSGHNPIEALLHGKPIFFGPAMERWTEVVSEIKSVWGGCEISDATALARNLIFLNQAPELYAQLVYVSKKLTHLEHDPILKNFELIRQGLPER
ncbi:MAG: hypothetical protein HY390_05390 [Deltaproteobacteria bacterium]|nr:hypothetical protein [Deltaproteobacteria bacterium]